MAWGVVAGSAIAAAGTYLSYDAQRDAAKKAARAQKSAADQGIEFERERLAQEKQIYEENMAEYRRKQALLEKQQERSRVMLAPYMQSGQGALFEMMALTGLAAPQQVAMPVAETVTADQAFAQRYGLNQPPQQQGRQIGTTGLKASDIAGTMAPRGGLPGGLQTQQGSMIQLGAGQTPFPTQKWEYQTPFLGDTSKERMTKLTGGYYVPRPGGEIPKEGDPDYVDYILAQGRAKRSMSPDLRKTYDKVYAQVKQQQSEATGLAAEQNAVLQMEADEQGKYQIASPYAGMTGEQAQTQAIEKISSSPLLKELTAQGEQAMLQQSSATGGLRGGNIQGALAQYRPRMLQEELERQYARLASMSSVGQQTIMGAPTTNVPALPQYSGASQIPSLYGDIGASQAGLALANGQAQGQLYSNLGQGLGYLGYGLANRRQTQTSPTSPYADYYPGL